MTTADRTAQRTFADLKQRTFQYAAAQGITPGFLEVDRTLWDWLLSKCQPGIIDCSSGSSIVIAPRHRDQLPVHLSD